MAACPPCKESGAAVRRACRGQCHPLALASRCPSPWGGGASNQKHMKSELGKQRRQDRWAGKMATARWGLTYPGPQCGPFIPPLLFPGSLQCLLLNVPCRAQLGSMNTRIATMMVIIFIPDSWSNFDLILPTLGPERWSKPSIQFLQESGSHGISLASVGGGILNSITFVEKGMEPREAEVICPGQEVRLDIPVQRCD